MKDGVNSRVHTYNVIGKHILVYVWELFLHVKMEPSVVAAIVVGLVARRNESGKRPDYYTTSPFWIINHNLLRSTFPFTSAPHKVLPPR